MEPKITWCNILLYIVMLINIPNPEYYTYTCLPDEVARGTSGNLPRAKSLPDRALEKIASDRGNQVYITIPGDKDISTTWLFNRSYHDWLQLPFSGYNDEIHLPANVVISEPVA